MSERIATGTHVRDPICGMDVDPASAAHRVEHAGITHYFCGVRCLDAFRKNPEAALAKASQREAAGSSCSARKNTNTPPAVESPRARAAEGPIHLSDAS